MKATDKPDVLFKAISKIENKYRKTAIKKWADKDKVELVMAKVHKSYKPLIATEAVRTGNGLSYKDLLAAMSMYYRTVINGDEDIEEDEEDNEESKEVLLVATTDIDW